MTPPTNYARLDIMPQGLKPWWIVCGILWFHVLSLNIQMCRHVTLRHFRLWPTPRDWTRPFNAQHQNKPAWVRMSVTNAMVFYIFHCIKTMMMTMMHMELPWLKGATGAERQSAQTSGTSKQEAVPLFSPLFFAGWLETKVFYGLILQFSWERR